MPRQKKTRRTSAQVANDAGEYFLHKHIPVVGTLDSATGDVIFHPPTEVVDVTITVHDATVLVSIDVVQLPVEEGVEA